MKYVLSVRDAAEQDLTEAYDYYESQAPGLGTRFHDAVAQVLRKIETNPLLYAATRLPRYRQAVLDVFPFLIIYTVERQTIYVIAVHNARRSPDIWEKRTK